MKADITTRPVTVGDGLPEYYNSFEGTDEGVEMGIASDNKFIYTSTYSVDGLINKYTMAGEFVESFTIDGIEGIRNIAYDGENFYVGDYSTSFYKVDMDKHEIIETLSISEYSRHLAYVPDLDNGNGGFEVGDWETSIYVTKNGSKIGNGPTLLGASGTAYHDGLLYAFEQGGENAHTIGIYDFNTLQRVGSIDMSEYSELGDISDASAGGMSVVNRPDGSAFIAMALQRPNNTSKFIFIELESVKGVVGYNVYRDGQKLTEEPTARRYFEESIDTEGTYNYAIETVYIDGTTAAERAEASVQIGMASLKMAVRNADDHNGHGSISLLRSIGGTDDADFIQMNAYQTNEAWTEIEADIPEGTEYLAIRKPAGIETQFIDAVRLFTQKTPSSVYAYDIFRNGEQINEQPVTGISYIDRNLVPGHYDYQARLTTTLSAVSELSDKVGIDLDYDNGGLAPTGLKAGYEADGSVKLSWQFPALGEPIYLRWHDGNSYDAGGVANGGSFFAGARWYASDLKDYEQLSLTDVEFYINQIPDALFVLVYEGSTLVRQQYVSDLRQYSFNNVKLDEPLAVNTSKDLLVAIYIEHNEITAPLGYDAGPANNGRGNLYSSDGQTWSLLSDSETGIDANWNISIGLSPYSNAPLEPNGAMKAQRKAFAPKKQAGPVKLLSVPAGSQSASQKNAFMGYNVYRNHERLNSETVTETSYIDATPADNKYLEYQVSAIYSVSGTRRHPCPRSQRRNARKPVRCQWRHDIQGHCSRSRRTRNTWFRHCRRYIHRQSRQRHGQVCQER